MTPETAKQLAAGVLFDQLSDLSLMALFGDQIRRNKEAGGGTGVEWLDPSLQTRAMEFVATLESRIREGSTWGDALYSLMNDEWLNVADQILGQEH